MNFRKAVLLLLAAVVIIAGYFGVRILLHGFTTAAEPFRLETIIARAARNFAIPRSARFEPNPLKPTLENVIPNRVFCGEGSAFHRRL